MYTDYPQNMGYKPLISGKKNKKSPLEIIEKKETKMAKGAGGNTSKPNDKPCGAPKGMGYPGPGPKSGTPFPKK